MMRFREQNNQTIATRDSQFTELKKENEELTKKIEERNKKIDDGKLITKAYTQILTIAKKRSKILLQMSKSL